MAVRFKRETDLRKELRRLFRAEVAAALKALDGAARRGEDLHAARKAIKRARELLRFAQPALGKPGRKACRKLGAVGRLLAVHRDRDAQARLLRRECGRQARLQPGPKQGPSRAEAVREAQQGLRRIIQRWEHARVDDLGLRDGREALRCAYRRARRCARACSAGELAEEALHDWRKAVKAFLIDAHFTRRWGGESWRAYQQQLSRLDDALGDTRDLRRLGRNLADGSDIDRAERAQARRCAARLERRSREELAQARRLANDLFAAKPKVFIGDILWPEKDG